MRHGAFTVFILNSRKELSIQKRSKNKFLWFLVWETSCSSHSLPGEKYVTASNKRLKKELGLDCNPKLKCKFQYQANYKNIGTENEVCALLLCNYDGQIKANPKEVAEYKWVNIKNLKKDLKKNPKKYAPWLKIAVECAVI